MTYGCITNLWRTFLLYERCLTFKTLKYLKASFQPSCIWFWEKLASTHLIAILTCRHHMIAVHINHINLGKNWYWKSTRLLFLWFICQTSTSEMAPSPMDKQIAACKSPHDWLVTLAIDLAALYDMWGWIRHQRCHLAVFSVDLVFAYNFVAFHHLLYL